MLDSDVGVAGAAPVDEPAAGGPSPHTQAGRQHERHDQGRRRRRYGRRRGVPPSGEWFVGRLGPANGEPFASIDDPDDSGPLRPRPEGLTTVEDLRLVALDCETTGQSPHRLIEIGAVAFTVRGHVESFETLVWCPDHINPYARRLHGISAGLLAGAPRPEPVLERFRRFIAGAVLVEHSADAFDTRLIARALGRSLDADNIDTSRLAARLWGLKDTIGLERLCAELGVAHRKPHHALADAEATAACFVALFARGGAECGWRTLDDLLRDGRPPPPRLVGARPPRRSTSAPATVAPPADDGRSAPARRRRRRGGRGRRRGTRPSTLASDQLSGGPADESVPPHNATDVDVSADPRLP